MEKDGRAVGPGRKSCPIPLHSVEVIFIGLMGTLWAPLCIDEKMGPIDLKVITKERTSAIYDFVGEGAISSGTLGLGLPLIWWERMQEPGGPVERKEEEFERC